MDFNSLSDEELKTAYLSAMSKGDQQSALDIQNIANLRFLVLPEFTGPPQLPDASKPVNATMIIGAAVIIAAFGFYLHTAHGA